MNSIERRTVFALGMVYATRMLGLFMILPVFALYAEHLEAVTPFLIGIAIGIYGLAQAFLQIPMGKWSDRIGRKPVIIIGLFVFALGSVVAALADSIHGVIIGRALQGAGAIAAALMALAADLTREKYRTRVMAMIGASIGASFVIALVVGPILDQWVGVSGIFWITALLAIAGVVLVAIVVPSPQTQGFQRDNQVVTGLIGNALRNGQLLRLDFGVFVLHMILTANFVVVPLMLRDLYGIPGAEHWQVYLPVLLVSLVLMIPIVLVAEKMQQAKSLLLASVIMLVIVEGSLALVIPDFFWFAVLFTGFFWAFNFLEASLPSLVSKISPAGQRGTSMGVFSSSQFFGAFCGGAMAGLIVQYWGAQAVFGFSAGVLVLWLLIAQSMEQPESVGNRVLNVGKIDREQASELVTQFQQIMGVREAVIVPEEGAVYLKVNRPQLDEAAIEKIVATTAI